MSKHHLLLIVPVFLASSATLYADQVDIDKAREALTKQADDADSEKALEEVFEAAEKSYSLLKKGGMSLNYNVDYTYYGDQRIELDIKPVLDENNQPTSSSTINNADVTPVASHTITNAFTFDYGLANNLTTSIRVPFVAKFETEDDLSAFSVGDLSTTLRWQPFEYQPGKMSQTYFGTLRLPTGVSPYEIDENESLSTGSGTFGLSGGVSASKVLDPVVLFGSGSLAYTLPLTDVNQVRGGTLLQEVEPGIGISLSMGFAYSLSYDVSLSASFQASFSDETELTFFDGRTGTNQTSTTGSQMSAITNFALGIRVSPKTIANVNVGFGMTELSPDVILGLSLPIDIEGWKPSPGN